MIGVDLKRYRTLIFDCDGVILDSNSVKTSAFIEAARPFGAVAVAQFRHYHLTNGGISRYRKFRYFLEEILDSPEDEATYDQLLWRFSATVRAGLMVATVTGGLDDLRRATSEASWLIVSGSDETELQEVCDERKISGYFDGGIFGSPDSKETILSRGEDEGVIRRPALFIGDSRHDYEVSSATGHDFVFVEEWTEFFEWRSYQDQQGFPSVSNISELVAG